MINGKMVLEAGTLRGLLNKSGIIELREVGYQVGVSSSTTFDKEALVNKIVERLSAEKRPMNGKYYEATDFDTNEILQCFLGETKVKTREAQGYLDEFDYGAMLRESNLQSGKFEVFVPKWLMEKFDLRGGDYIVGETCQLSSNSVLGLYKVKLVNGEKPLSERKKFSDLKVVPPKHKLSVSGNVVLNTVDSYTPIAEGMRSLWITDSRGNAFSRIISELPAVFSKQKIKTYSLFLGETPEIKTELEEKIENDLIYTTCAEDVSENFRLAHMIFDKAQREVESGKKVAIILSRIESIDNGKNFNKIRSMFGSSKYTKNGSLTIVMCERKDYVLDDIADSIVMINNRNGELFHDYLKSYTALKDKE